MPRVSEEFHNKKIATVSALRSDRYPHWTLWRELADYYLPRRYVWLLSDTERRVRNAKNPYILDGTGTNAARTLASGMMNGITSPSRPWFRLRVANFEDDSDTAARVWLDEVTRRIMLIMAESNFYNAMATLYLDLVVFGTGAMLIYEDFDSVIRCYNPALGEFYLGQSSALRPNIFAREFTYKVHQLAEEFGEENCSDTVRNLLRQGGAHLHHNVHITHLIEPNIDNEGYVPKRFRYRECYWETNGKKGLFLRSKGFNDLPGVFPRWELTGNDVYGMSPSMDALGDVIQLQQETKKKGQGLDKMVSPPLLADVQLEHRPMALMPNGVTFVSGIQNHGGAKPVYQINLPIGELTLDIREIQARIRETFHNDLFKMISQLDTVRSATEIDARREEKLVLLGPVLERFENEALDPAINRIFNVAQRAGVLPPAPPEIEGADLEIQYVSVLSAAQRAVAAIPTERWLQLIANVAPVYPKAVNAPNWDSLILNYGRDIGVAARDMRSPEEMAQLGQQADELAASREQAAQGAVLVDSAKQLSETDVGGGRNALAAMIGG